MACFDWWSTEEDFVKDYDSFFSKDAIAQPSKHFITSISHMNKLGKLPRYTNAIKRFTSVETHQKQKHYSFPDKAIANLGGIKAELLQIIPNLNLTIA